jgi:aspartyl-tRNA(Asn)/glutamyl-tRNA(Gln) amidotransferase subunit A
MRSARHLTLCEAADAIARGELTSESLVAECIKAAEALNPRLNAFVALEAEEALAAARDLDRERAAGRLRGPLHGVPLAHKDMYYRAGKVSGCGSKIRENFVPNVTSSLVARLEAAGAVTIGRLHMSEFAMGAAVAARLVFGSLGSDTGGSVRLPAAMCGVAGLKPTQHLLATDGMMGLSESLDCPGPLARSSRDIARLMEVMTGRPYESALDGSVAGLVLGIPTSFYWENVAEPVAERLGEARRVLERLGVRFVDVDIPDHTDLADLADAVWTPEAAAIHLQWLRTRPGDYGDQVRARLTQGLSVSATAYLRASQLRTLMLEAMIAGPLSNCDALFVPAMRITVPTDAETDVAAGTGMREALAGIAALTRPLSYLGLPGLVTPAGFDPDGLPIGLQLIGRPLEEPTLLRIADAFERETRFIAQAPPI